MKATKTIKFLEKWNKQYPENCKILISHLEQINKDIDSQAIPAEMIIEFHQAVAHDINEEINGPSSSNEMEQVRFEDLPLNTEFYWSGKQYIKTSNEFMMSSQTNCLRMDTNQEQRFKPDYMCMVPKYIAVQIGA